MAEDGTTTAPGRGGRGGVRRRGTDADAGRRALGGGGPGRRCPWGGTTATAAAQRCPAGPAGTSRERRPRRGEPEAGREGGGATEYDSRPPSPPAPPRTTVFPRHSAVSATIRPPPAVGACGGAHSFSPHAERTRRGRHPLCSVVWSRGWPGRFSRPLAPNMVAREARAGGAGGAREGTLGVWPEQPLM